MPMGQKNGGDRLLQALRELRNGLAVAHRERRVDDHEFAITFNDEGVRLHDRLLRNIGMNRRCHACQLLPQSRPHAPVDRSGFEDNVATSPDQRLKSQFAWTLESGWAVL